MTAKVISLEEFTFTLSRAKRDDLVDMLTSLSLIVDRNSHSSYAEIFSKRLTQRRIKAIIKILDPERKPE